MRWHWAAIVTVAGLLVGLALVACTQTISSGRISGQVVDSESGEPVEDALVSTAPPSAEVRTDREGQFELEDVPVGVYSVRAQKKGYRLATEARVSVIAGRTFNVDLSLVRAAPFPLARVVAVGREDGETYPKRRVAITLSGGYGDRDNNKIITSGLNSVGVGTYVYLQGRETDDQGRPLSSWSWELIPPPGSTATLERTDGPSPRFLADREGTYTIKVSAVNDVDATLSSELTVSAGRYVGVENCSLCHNGSFMPDVVGTWRQTPHAAALEDILAMLGKDRDSCLRCHTVGYDETADNGGFDDAARAAGWKPSEGSAALWLKEKGRRRASLAALAGVQCENCHGPGQPHTGESSFEPGVCGQCHDQDKQWANSGHALTGAARLHTAESPACVKCHTGEGFVEVQVRGQAPVFPEMATPDQPANLEEPALQAPIACAACHDPHTATFVTEDNAAPQLRMRGSVTTPMGVTVEAGISAVCVMCHANDASPKDMRAFVAGERERGAHASTQADVFFGFGAYDYGETFDNSPHTTWVVDGCVACHMAPNPVAGPGPDRELGTPDDDEVLSVGGHSFAVSGFWEGEQVDNVASCNARGCHAAQPLVSANRPAFGDYDGDGTIEGIQDEVRGLLGLLADYLPENEDGEVLSYPVGADRTTEAERQALWNYWLIANDGSLGIHNTSFAVQVLQTTYEHLVGSEVPGADIR
jgi:mono/diheme cytochrome c family protein